MYVRLNLIVEGQTEENFVNQTLKPCLGSLSVGVSVRVATTKRTRGRKFRGGLSTYAQARNDIIRWIREDQNPDVRFTTMFDLYGLPDDFPGYEAAASHDDPYQRVETLEDALAQDIADPRFIPYIQLHEFEALLLSSPQKLESQFSGYPDAIAKLARTVADFESPEHVNDSTVTAPSKRIIDAVPEYQRAKASAGPIVAGQIGLPTMRSKCKHFACWLAKLEKLATEN